MNIFKRIRSFTRSRRGGAVSFTAAAAATALLLAAGDAAWIGGAAVPPLAHALGTGAAEVQGVRVTAALSQTKLVSGQNGEVYLRLSVETPEDSASQAAGPADVVVVLDRSGSMSEAAKMPYAKQAIYRLINELGPDDRLGLVSFDSYARVDFPLTEVNQFQKGRLHRIVSLIRPGSSTNMSGGLELAAELIAPAEGRVRRVILLSDGEANQGKVRPQELSHIAHGLAERGAVVSAIGMGLSFNEVVLSGIADYGMGHYSFLENVSGLDAILAKDLRSARSMFARASSIELELPDGVRLLDAAGYPIRGTGGKQIVVDTGQLTSGTERTITMTLRVPTERVGELAFGPLRFSYSRDGENVTLPLPDAYALAVVPQEQRAAAVASIKKEVFKDSWLRNNLGRMRKELNAYLREGDKTRADAVLASYGAAVNEAEKASGIDISDEKLSAELDRLKQDVDDAFVGAPAAQEAKQNRLGKAVFSRSLEEQRAVIKK